MIFIQKQDIEYFNSLNYYADRSYHAGEDFLETFEEGIQSVIRFPAACGIVENGMPPIQRCILGRFPFSIVFVDTVELIYIIAVAHQSRHPDYWKNRLKDIS